MTLVDKNLVCADCGSEFVHSAADQERYLQRGFTNEPKRCPTCRERKRRGGPGSESRSSSGSRGSYGGGGGGEDRAARELYPAVCAACGQETQVPFMPKGNRPVYCRPCYMATRGR